MRILLVFLLLSLSLLWSCKQQASTAQEQPPPAKTYPMLSEMELPLCMSCRTMADFRRFEDSLGSKKIYLKLDENAKVFLGVDYAKSDTMDQYYGEYGFNLTIWKDYSYIETWIRKPTHDSLPFIAVMYKSDISASSPSDSIVEDAIHKFFFSDPILDTYADALFEPAFIPDIGYLDATWDTVQNKLWYGLPPYLRDSNIQDVADAFFYNSDINRRLKDAEFKYSAGEYSSGRTRVIVKEAPYRDRYRSRHMGGSNYIGLPNPQAVNKPDYYDIYVTWGWSSSASYYYREEKEGDKEIHRYDIRPQDMAFYITYTYYEPSDTGSEH